jgi:cytochrome c peroxidase
VKRCRQRLPTPLFALLVLLPLIAACDTTQRGAVVPDDPIATAASTLTVMEQLGKELFFAKISSPSSMSCADCHAPSAGWTGPNAGINLHGAVYRGAVPQRFGNRKPPSSAYASFAPIFHFDERIEAFIGGTFWDGRATGERLGSPVAEQALGPFLNPVEQNMSDPQAVCHAVARSKKLSQRFEQAWGHGSLDCSDAGFAQTYDMIGLSIAAYEGSPEVNPFTSTFDAYWGTCLAAGNSEEACGLAEGEKDVLDPYGIFTEEQFLGLIEFGEYCSACHISHVAGPGGTPPLFTDFEFHNIGVPKNPGNPFYRMDTVYLADGSPINPEGAAFVDLGLGGFLRTRQEYAHLADANDCKFKTPTLRNVDARPGGGFPKAYMHNGVFKSLHEVVDFYNTRDVEGRVWPAAECDRNLNDELFTGLPIGNFELDDEAVDAIVAFMATLTDGRQR